MRGITHALTGAAAGLMLAPVITGHEHSTIGELAVVALVTTGASYAPDLDHPQATIAHTFGEPTRQLAKVVAKVSGGHRGATHTLPGCGAFGLAAWITATFGAVVGVWLAGLAGAGPVVTSIAGQVGQGLAVICCLGLGVGALGLTNEGMASTVAMFAGCTAFVLVTTGLGISYAWVPAAVVAGCLAHLAGDLCTEQGVMLLWPFTRHRFKVATIDTGKWVECAIVAPLITLAVVAAGLYRLGYWPQTWAVLSALAT
jgi:membrane-bound metal-dependent hydrolase YbcI (DUF457 family)